jgi:uncharacterized membrane protein YphA (DoxX/SURF4 family)
MKTSAPAEMRTREIVSWVLALALAYEFLHAAYGKLTGQPGMRAEFDLFGYPLWFMYVTGTIEVIASALVLIPRFALSGAIVMVCVMLGALYSHLTHGQSAKIEVPLLLLVGALLLGWLRRPAPRLPASPRIA